MLCNMPTLDNSLFGGLDMPTARVPRNASSGSQVNGGEDWLSTPPRDLGPDEHFPSGLSPPPSLTGSYTPHLTWLGQTSSDLVRERVATMKLSASYSMDLYTFAEDPTAKQLIKIFAQMLLNTQMLEELRGAATWTPADELMTAIDKYCMAFVLSSRTAAYKGLGGMATTCVINILVASKLSDLPGTKDLGRMAKIRSIVSNRLTAHRATLKARIKLYLPKLDQSAAEEDQNLGNDVGTLTAAMVQGTSVLVTTELRERAMLLRHFMNNDDSPDDQGFWDRVDRRLAQLRALDREGKLSLKRAIQAAEDKNYGPPCFEYPVALVSELEPWQRLVDDYSEKAADQVMHTTRRRKPGVEKENEAAVKRRKYNQTTAASGASTRQTVGGDATNTLHGSSPSVV